MRTSLLAALVAVSIGVADAAVREQPVEYTSGGTTMKGIVVYDDAAKGRRPGVIVVHEWWGITPHVRGEARKLAEQGYVAFVADMYGDAKTADNPKDANVLAESVVGKPEVERARFDAAKNALAKQPNVDPKRIAAIGFCFGGMVVLEMARSGEDLRGVVAFHAGLDSVAGRATPGKVKAKVLVLNGDADPFIKPEQVAAFRKEMQAANVDFRYVGYPGAVHAFTNPQATELGKKFNLPLAYDPKVDQASKAEMRKFLAAVLK